MLFNRPTDLPTTILPWIVGFLLFSCSKEDSTRESSTETRKNSIVKTNAVNPPATITEKKIDPSGPKNHPIPSFPFKIERPFDDWTKTDIINGLKKAGWRITMETETEFTVMISARKEGVNAELSYFSPAPPSQKKEMESIGAEVHEADSSILAIVIQDDRAAAKQLIDQLVGQ